VILDLRPPPLSLVDFRAYMKKQYADEQLDFLLACKDFRLLPTRASAEVIARTYIREGADRQVNISAGLRKEIEHRLSGPDSVTDEQAMADPERKAALAEVFMDAEAEAMRMLDSDVFQT
jgi:hypothetical protein